MLTKMLKMLMSRLAELLKLAEHVLSCCARFEYSCLQTSWRFKLSFWPAGAKEVPMSYVQYTLHAKNKLGYGEDEILKKWNEYENNEDILRDQLGPENSRLRLYIPKGDYIIREDISGYAKQRELGTKARRATDQEMEAADRHMQEDMPRWSDEQFRTGSATGATRNLAVEQTASIFEV